MEWVLILWVSLGQGGITTANFNSEKACKYAGREAVKGFAGFHVIPRAICVPKGENGEDE